MRLATRQGLTAPADTQRIEQVVRLLLEQACRRNPRGCWMDIELKRPLVGLARLEVRDYGRPLSAEQRARLVSPNGRDGWLTVCRYIVDKHGGTLNLEFPSEGGVRMVLTLPTQHGRVMPTAV